MPDTTLRENVARWLHRHDHMGREWDDRMYGEDTLHALVPRYMKDADDLLALATPEPSVSVEATGPSVTWTAANWTPTHRPVMVLLAPIGVDGRCTGCGATPSRETGSCRCPKRLDATLRASVTPTPLDPERLAMAMYEHWVKAHICNRDCFPEVMRRYARLSEAHDD